MEVTLKGTNKNYLPSEITISVNLVSDARLTPVATVGDKTYYADADGVISVTLKDLEKAVLSTNAADAVITKQISEQAGFNIVNSGVRANGAKAGTYDFPFRATAENSLDTDFTLRVTIAPIVEYKVDDDQDYAAVTERTVEVGYGDGAQIPVLAKLANGDNAVTLSAGATPLYTAWGNGVLTILPNAPAGSSAIKLTPRADGVSIPDARLTLTVKVLSGRDRGRRGFRSVGRPPEAGRSGRRRLHGLPLCGRDPDDHLLRQGRRGLPLHPERAGRWASRSAAGR